MTCPVCDGALRPFLRLEGLPAFCNVLYVTSEEALAAPRGTIELSCCEDCGLIRNTAFDPELVRYSPTYENSLHFSPAFRAFAEDLARRLIERYDLHGKDIVDIGCGKGDFLRLLCRDTGNRGVGYDPSYEGPLQSSDGTHVRFVREHYSATRAEERADLISCRHVLEHLESPRELMVGLEGTDATLYFEMPDAGYMLRESAIWDVIYEHVSYFTAPALRALFARHGFEALDLGSSFGGQYLYIEASRHGPAGRAADGVDPAALVGGFGATYDRTVRTWRKRLAEASAAGRRVALWGAGSKGVTFLNVVPEAAAVMHVFDVNARKQGRHVPGTGQQVLDPRAVAELRPDVVLVMNRLYADEIRRHLVEAGVDAEAWVV